MTTYEINNQVRIMHTPCRYFGYVGTIVDVNRDQHFPYGVGGLEDWVLWFGAGELVKVLPEAQEGA